MEQRVALITGAGSGIGRAAAGALARDGFALVLSGRRVERLEEAAAEFGELVPVLVERCDVGDPEQVRALFGATMARFGRLDVLFNNAGVGAPGIPLEELTFEQWSTVVATNLTGTFLCTQEAFKIMKAQVPPGGRIINNGSISSQVPRPNSSPYTATKHGITGLTRATSLDGRRFNIACGQIDVGNAGTDLTQRMTEGILQANGSVLVEPTFDVAHVASAISYMASLPLDANVQFLTVTATQMPYIGRG